jgi:hypothetical protein
LKNLIKEKEILENNDRFIKEKSVIFISKIKGGKDV